MFSVYCAIIPDQIASDIYFYTSICIYITSVYVYDSFFVAIHVRWTP